VRSRRKHQGAFSPESLGFFLFGFFCLSGGRATGLTRGIGPTISNHDAPFLGWAGAPSFSSPTESARSEASEVAVFTFASISSTEIAFLRILRWCFDGPGKTGIECGGKASICKVKGSFVRCEGGDLRSSLRSSRNPNGADAPRLGRRTTSHFFSSLEISSLTPRRATRSSSTSSGKGNRRAGRFGLY